MKSKRRRQIQKMSSDEQEEEGLLLAVGPKLGPPAADGTFCQHHECYSYGSRTHSNPLAL